MPPGGVLLTVAYDGGPFAGFAIHDYVAYQALIP